MKIDSTEHLFGTEEFASLGKKDKKSKKKKSMQVSGEEGLLCESDPEPEAGVPTEISPRITRSMGLHSVVAREPDSNGGSVDAGSDQEKRERLSAPSMSEVKGYVKQLFPRPMIVMGVFLFMITFVVISVVSLHVKMRKNALSYELSAQTRMMRRLEKRKAMFELEYSFLRSRQSVSSKVKETGWTEITPHSIKFIKPVGEKEGRR